MDRTEIFKFLVYQQFYKEENIISDRRKEVNVLVKDSGRTIHKFKQPLIAILPLWETNIDKFTKKLGKQLSVDPFLAMSTIEEKFDLSLQDKSTWTGFDEDQLLTLLCTEFYKIFYERTIEQAYLSIVQEDWIESERRPKLANEYSFLLNLLYFRELAKLVSEDETEVNSLINIFLPSFIEFNLDDYNLEINKVNLL